MRPLYWRCLYDRERKSCGRFDGFRRRLQQIVQSLKIGQDSDAGINLWMVKVDNGYHSVIQVGVTPERAQKLVESG